ncbi:DUF1697 domain-containing protein [Bryobacter aggregatus]|uniref:DUF1697 domain-containing protein n=1 Tax=Bryobacter aggregatus TaxID=360054 RepID=UPI0004E1EFCD|nr:DUF1697 domain-containing protein [Bryobacter aggregatus]
MATRYVALLRGVNLGGRTVVPMKELARIFTDLGCSDVVTYIQSGNVVFRAAPKVLQAIPSKVPLEIEKLSGYKTSLTIRDAAEMRKILAANPYPDADLSRVHVVFLADLPKPEHAAQLDPLRSAPDQHQLLGQQVYLHLPNGVADSKLTNAYFDSKLKTMSTARNWRTVTKLLELLEA